MTCASRTEIHQNLILKVDLLVKNWLENVTMTKLVLLKHFTPSPHLTRILVPGKKVCYAKTVLVETPFIYIVYIIYGTYLLTTKKYNPSSVENIKG